MRSAFGFIATFLGCGRIDSSIGTVTSTVTTMHNAQKEAYIDILSLIGTEPSPINASAQASATMASAPGRNSELKVFLAASCLSLVSASSRK